MDFDLRALSDALNAARLEQELSWAGLAREVNRLKPDQRPISTSKIALPLMTLTTDARLREMNYGELNGAPDAAFPTDEMACIEQPFANGECCRDVEARMLGLLNELKVSCGSGASVAIFAHKYPQLALNVNCHRIRPGAHIFVGSKAAWYDITDGLPQFEEFPR